MCLLTEWLFVYDSNENYLTRNRQYGDSGKLPCLVLLFNVCYCSSPVTEFLATIMRLLNDYSRFYPHANRCEVAVIYLSSELRQFSNKAKFY